MQPIINNTPQQIPNIPENNDNRNNFVENYNFQRNFYKNKPQCENCYKFGHTKEICRGNSYISITCQLCNKTGHSAPRCFQYFQQSKNQ